MYGKNHVLEKEEFRRKRRVSSNSFSFPARERPQNVYRKFKSLKATRNKNFLIPKANSCFSSDLNHFPRLFSHYRLLFLARSKCKCCSIISEMYLQFPRLTEWICLTDVQQKSGIKCSFVYLMKTFSGFLCLAFFASRQRYEGSEVKLRMIANKIL